MTSKEYEELAPWDLFGNAEYRNWLCGLWRKKEWLMRSHALTTDNRKTFRKIFGKPHFYYRGSFYFHCWSIEFRGKTYVILTADTKGTCLECSRISSDYRTSDGKDHIAFAEWLLDLLHQKQPPECVGKKCRMCGDDAFKKFEEVVFDSNTSKNKEPLTAYVCIACFHKIKGVLP